MVQPTATLQRTTNLTIFHLGNASLFRLVYSVLLITAAIISTQPVTAHSQLSALIPKDTTGQAQWLNQRNAWVDSVMSTLTEDQKIGQLFMVAAYSNRGPEHEQELAKLIREQGIGGLIFFQGGPGRQARMTNRLQALANVPLMIGMDAEWGLGMRLDSIPDFPRQVTLGAIQDNQFIYTMGAEIARELKLLGVHVNFAPVVDVNSNPLNPVIGSRSFGEYKFDVARKGIAYMKGMQDNGVMASAKHFPGHGDTDTDSHLTLPVVRHDMERIRSLEMYPFQRLMEDSLGSIMVAHLNIPAIDNRPNRATTLSPAAVNGLLRKEMNYDGLVFTDALNMKGVSQFFKPGEVDLEALMAGNDVLLFSEDVPTAVKQIKRAIKKGTLKSGEVNEHVRRILKAKYWAGLHSYQPINTDRLTEKINGPIAELVRQKLYENAITVVKNQRDFLPIKNVAEQTFAVLNLGGNAEDKTFTESLNKYAVFDNYHLPMDASPAEYEQMLYRLSLYDVVVVGVQGMNRSGSKQFGLSTEALNFIDQVRRNQNVIFSVFGIPYSLQYFEQAKYLICAYEENEYTQKLVPAVIFGGIEANGELPVSVSGLVRRKMGDDTRYLQRLHYSVPEDVGMDSHVLDNVDAIAKEAIELGATPGCQILVARKGSIVYQKSFGHLTYDSLQAVTNETVYDIASITKVAATLQVMMFLYERDLIDLDKPIVNYLPDLKGTNKARMTLRNILAHQAGLVPYIPFWKFTLGDMGLSNNFYSSVPTENYQLQVSEGIYAVQSIQDTVWQWIKDSELRDLPRRQKTYDYKYSDVGYYIMQRIAEKILNQPMAEFLAQNLYEPLGLSTMTYLPLCKYNADRIAPTEHDTYFRNSLVCGMVHDQGAAMLGGIAGHAGLFSNSSDLATLIQMNLQDGIYGGRRFLAPGTVSYFAKKQFEDNRRGLGWDKPEMQEHSGPTSNYASAETFGHTGFTGTAVWADPRFDLVYIFLSNRIYPDAGNTKLIKYNIRTRIMDEIYKSIQSFDKSYNP